MTDENEIAFWQKVALEAIANDDPAKAYEIRMEKKYDVSVRPRLRDTATVSGTWDDLYELIHSLPDFEIESATWKETEAPYENYEVEGIKYTDHSEYQN